MQPSQFRQDTAQQSRCGDAARQSQGSRGTAGPDWDPLSGRATTTQPWLKQRNARVHQDLAAAKCSCGQGRQAERAPICRQERRPNPASTHMFQIGLHVVHEEDIVHGQSALRQVLQEPGMLLDACQGRPLQRSTPAGLQPRGSGSQQCNVHKRAPPKAFKSVLCSAAHPSQGAWGPSAQGTRLGQVHREHIPWL